MTKEQMIAAFLRRCATVAETRFVMALVAECEVTELDGEILCLSYCEPGALGADAEFCLEAQVTLLPGTRTDFVLRSGDVLIAAVEIDDPSHWKQEEKADADRLRDLTLLAASGLPTIRISNARAMRMGGDLVRLIVDVVLRDDRQRQHTWSDGWRSGRQRAESTRDGETLQ